MGTLAPPHLVSHPSPLIPKLEKAIRSCMFTRATLSRAMGTFTACLWSKDRALKRPPLVDLKDQSNLKFLTLTSAGFDRRQEACSEAISSIYRSMEKSYLGLKHGRAATGLQAEGSSRLPRSDPCLWLSPAPSDLYPEPWTVISLHFSGRSEQQNRIQFAKPSSQPPHSASAAL